MPNLSATRRVSRVVCAALATSVLLAASVPVARATPQKPASIPEVEQGIQDMSTTAAQPAQTNPVAADEEAVVTDEEGVFKLPIKFTLPRDPLITISLRNASIRDIIQVLAKRGGLNILIDTAAAKERIDLDVREVRLSEALTMVLAIANLRYARVGNTYMVATADSLVRRGFNVFTTKSFHINNASVDQIKTKLEEMFSKVGEQATAAVAGGAAGGFTSTAAAPAQNTAVGPGGTVTAVPPGSLGAVAPPAPAAPAQAGGAGGASASADILKPKIISDLRTRTVTIIATPDDLRKAEKFIAFLDVPQPQIFVEIKVLSLTSSVSRQLGASYGLGAGKVGVGMLNTNPQSTSNGVDAPGNVSAGNFGINFSSLGNFTPNFNASLTALLNDSKAKVLANPRVAMIVGGDGSSGSGGAGGDSATIDLTDSVPVISSQQTTVSTTQSVQFIDIGSKLTIKNVHIDDEHNVVITIDAEVSDRGQDVILNGNVTPEKIKRAVQTVMRIKDNESLVIGGLISRSTTNSHNRVPLLGEIPILGLLFSQSTNGDSDSEIMIVVTPHIATEVLNEKTLQVNGRRSPFMDEFKDFRPFKDLR